MNIQDLTALFRQEGDAMVGSELGEQDLISLARAEGRAKPFCVVQEWFYLEADVSKLELKMVSDRGWQPALLLALKVLRDERGRYPAGGWVRSGFQVGFYQGCMFETENTLYLLQGNGHRKRVGLGVLSHLS